MRELYSFFGQKGSVQSVSYHYGPLILFEVKFEFFERREQVGFFPVIHGTVGFEVIATLKVMKISNIQKMIALCLIFNNFSDQNFYRGVVGSRIQSILIFSPNS